MPLQLTSDQGHLLQEAGVNLMTGFFDFVLCQAVQGETPLVWALRLRLDQVVHDRGALKKISDRIE